MFSNFRFNPPGFLPRHSLMPPTMEPQVVKTILISSSISADPPSKSSSFFVDQDFSLLLPGSLLCPPATRDEGYHLQLLPVDCNGVVLLSRWIIKESKRASEIPHLLPIQMANHESRVCALCRKNSLVPQHRLSERVGCAERSLCCYTEG